MYYRVKERGAHGLRLNEDKPNTSIENNINILEVELVK